MILDPNGNKFDVREGDLWSYHGSLFIVLGFTPHEARGHEAFICPLDSVLGVDTLAFNGTYSDYKLLVRLEDNANWRR